jgi:serine/threonine-protein kinase
MSRADAEAALEKAHLNGVFKRVESDQPKGTVVSTDPPPGTQVPRDSDVTVNVSRGPQKVPDVVGLTQAEAEQQIRAAGFVPSVSSDNTSTEPKGTVTNQTPAANQTLPQGATVYITVSTFEPSSPPTTPPTTPPTSLPTSPAT